MALRHAGKHLGQSGPDAEDRADIEVLIGGPVKKEIETGLHSLFGPPVTHHQRHLRQRVQDNGNIGFKLPFHLPAAEDMHHIVKKIGVAVGHLFKRLFAALLKQRVALPSVRKFPKRAPVAGGQQALSLQERNRETARPPRG